MRTIKSRSLSCSQKCRISFGKVHQSHYHMAKEALICKDPLHSKFGYLAISLSAMQILNGSYFYAADFNPAT